MPPVQVLECREGADGTPRSTQRVGWADLAPRGDASRIAEESRWVGEAFADTARAMHNGEMKPALVHGQATLEQAKSLVDDGVPVAPLPLPVTAPNQVN